MASLLSKHSRRAKSFLKERNTKIALGVMGGTAAVVGIWKLVGSLSGMSITSVAWNQNAQVASAADVHITVKNNTKNVIQADIGFRDPGTVDWWNYQPAVSIAPGQSYLAEFISSYLWQDATLEAAARDNTTGKEAVRRFKIDISKTSGVN